MKDAILEGIHPYASLKEYSGLVDANDGDLGAPQGGLMGVVLMDKLMLLKKIPFL